MATLKGQNLRILTYDTTASKFKCIGMATSCTINQSTNTEDANHKDIVGLASVPTVNSKSWQVSVESLDVTDMAALLRIMRETERFICGNDFSGSSEPESNLPGDAGCDMLTADAIGNCGLL